MNKNFVILALLVALVSVTIYSFPAIQTSGDSSQLDVDSSVCIYVNNKPVGECSHNTMTNSGLNWTRDLIGNAAVGGAMNVIGVGNGTTAESAALTDLNNRIADCGLAMAAGTYSTTGLGVGNWSITKLFTSTCAGIIVNTTALYNSTAPGTMFSGKNFSSSVTLQSGDQLNVTWYVWVS